jgi:cytochrome c556
MMGARTCLLMLVGFVLTVSQAAELEPELRVKQLMNGIITPATNTIWGAYQLETDAQWQEVENAAYAVIGAANLLALGGSAEGEAEAAATEQWQEFNAQMLAASRQVLTAVAARDEEALSDVGNNALYPPCESCHQQFQSQ